MLVIMQKWRHKNDVNGNPRRLWMIWNDSAVPIAVFKQDGRPTVNQLAAVAKKNDLNVVEISPVDIAPSEYRSTVRWAKDANLYIQNQEFAIVSIENDTINKLDTILVDGRRELTRTLESMEKRDRLM